MNERRASAATGKFRTEISADAESPSICAGINRHEAGDARVLRERGREPPCPEFCVVHREVHGEA